MTTAVRIVAFSSVLATACSDDGTLEQAGEDEGADTGGGSFVGENDTTTGSTGPLDPSLDDEDGGGEDAGAADSTTGPGTSGGGTPGCGTPARAGASDVEIEVDGTARTYLLVVPEGYDPSTPTPLVLGWHGLGSNAEQARAYFGIEEAAAGAAIVAYPNGLPVASLGGQSGWDLSGNGIDVAFFVAMVQQLGQEMCLDPDRIYSTGHSFGGYMSNLLGCVRPDVLRAIGSVAGGPAVAACAEDRVAGIMVHGTIDETVPFSQGTAARDALLARNGCADTTMPLVPEACVAYDGCDADYDVRWCEHSEATLQGHMWPRFAGAAIWEFFAGLEPKADED
jgi:poly(3-hydroxybutyrate) depolymerase